MFSVSWRARMDFSRFVMVPIVAADVAVAVVVAAVAAAAACFH